MLVAVLQLNLLNRPAGNGAATPREGLRTSSPENAAQVPPLPEFKPGEFSRSDTRPKEAQRAEASRTGMRPKEVKPDEFSRTGVRPMDAEEMARRRKQIDNFAEMGRAEEDKLHREKPKTGPPGKPESP